MVFMILLPISYEKALDLKGQTYEQAQSLRTNLVWQALDSIQVQEAIFIWLETLNSHHTRRNYYAGLKKLVEYSLLNPFISLQAFALVNHESIVDQIKQIKEWSECTRQARAACYISLTAFLDRRLQGVVKKAKTNKEKGSKTFFRVYEKVKTNAMNQSQWISFLKALEEMSCRDALIAKLTLQGGKRISEVLSLQVHQIDWHNLEITFMQSKTKGCIKQTVITYPESIMCALKGYIGDREEYVFVTRNGKPINLRHCARAFAKAGLKAHIPFKVTPHILRASNVTYLKLQGFSDSDIMKVTGHASAAMIYAYDKGSVANNASKKVCLVY